MFSVCRVYDVRGLGETPVSLSVFGSRVTPQHLDFLDPPLMTETLPSPPGLHELTGWKRLPPPVHPERGRENSNTRRQGGVVFFQIKPFGLVTEHVPSVELWNRFPKTTYGILFSLCDVA